MTRLVFFDLLRLISFEHTWNITEEDNASKHKCSANPMGYTERVLEVPDGEKKAEKFPEKQIIHLNAGILLESTCRLRPGWQ